MTIEVKGRWRKYPPDWPIIGKVRSLWYFTVGKCTNRAFGYSYDEYEGWEFNTLEFGLFAIHWGSGYESHKNNKLRNGK